MEKSSLKYPLNDRLSAVKPKSAFNIYRCCFDASNFSESVIPPQQVIPEDPQDIDRLRL
jgi:hypothetical protein